MPRLFRSRGSTGTGEGGDDMTLASGFSQGGSSVSDRILGRMKNNLSFRSSGTSGGGGLGMSGVSNPFASSASSLVSDGDRRMHFRANPMASSRSVDGGRGGILRTGSSRRNVAGTSVAGVEAMEEMDSSEAMALTGKSLGRRRSSRKLRPGGPSQRSIGEATTLEPVEYSLAELRGMSLEELEKVMHQAGVPLEDITRTLHEDADGGAGADTIGEDQKKNLLVALFVNSGHVKLVPNAAAAERRTTVSSITVERRTTPSSAKSEHTKSDTVGSGDAGDAVSTNSDSKSKQRKSKLEKIAELKTENTKVKRENKSLKKTVKKLLGQLADAVSEKDHLQTMVDEGAKSTSQKEAEEEMPKTSLHSLDISDISKSERAQDAEDDDVERPPYEVNVLNGEAGKQTKSESASKQSSIDTDKSQAKIIASLKNKIRKEREAHQNTEYRLKAEIDILAKEVDGLQRELALSLKAVDEAKKKARSTREAASSAKQELRGTTKKVKELTAEAEARDKLIATFSQILLQKVGLEGGGDGNSLLDAEEKEGDEHMIEQVEGSLTAVKLQD